MRGCKGDTMSWKDADAKMKSDHIAVARDNAEWMGNVGGRLYVVKGGLYNTYTCYRDFNCYLPAWIWHVTTVNYDWGPSDEEKKATDWREYGEL